MPREAMRCEGEEKEKKDRRRRRHVVSLYTYMVGGVAAVQRFLPIHGQPLLMLLLILICDMDANDMIWLVGCWGVVRGGRPVC